MRVKSLSNSTDQEYIVCQIKLIAEQLHAQSDEKVPGWEGRTYGSAFTCTVTDGVAQAIKDASHNCYFTKSLYDGGSVYIVAQVRQLLSGDYEFQLLRCDGNWLAFQVEASNGG